MNSKEPEEQEEKNQGGPTPVIELNVESQEGANL